MRKEIIKREFRLLLRNMVTPVWLVFLLLSVNVLFCSFWLEDSITSSLRMSYFLLMNAVLHLPVKKILYYLPMDTDGVFMEIKIRTLLKFLIIIVIYYVIGSMAVLIWGVNNGTVMPQLMSNFSTRSNLTNFGDYLASTFYFDFAMAIFVVGSGVSPAYCLKDVVIYSKKENIVLLMACIMIIIQFIFCTIAKTYKIRHSLLLVLTVFLYVLLIWSVIISFRQLKRMCRQYEHMNTKRKYF